MLGQTSVLRREKVICRYMYTLRLNTFIDWQIFPTVLVVAVFLKVPQAATAMLQNIYSSIGYIFFHVPMWYRGNIWYSIFWIRSEQTFPSDYCTYKLT